MVLSGKVAVVTGARGVLGQAAARRFVEAGADIVLVGRKLTDLRGLERELRLGRKTTVLSVGCDVRSTRKVELLAQTVKKTFGKLDVIFHAAAVLGPIGEAHLNDPKVWLDAMMTNLGGTYLICSCLASLMIKSNTRGSIITVSGGGATSPRPKVSAYAASKTGVVRLTEVLAHELATFGIRANCIAPGRFYSSLTEEIITSATSEGELQRALRTKVSAINPTETAELAVFLASDESREISGKLINVVLDDWRNLVGTSRLKLTDDAGTLRRIPIEGITRKNLPSALQGNDQGKGGGA